jgi:hypothetical protein
MTKPILVALRTLGHEEQKIKKINAFFKVVLGLKAGANAMVTVFGDFCHLFEKRVGQSSALNGKSANGMNERSHVACF